MKASERFRVVAGDRDLRAWAAERRQRLGEATMFGVAHGDIITHHSKDLYRTGPGEPLVWLPPHAVEALPPTQAVERAEVEERIAVELLNRPRPVGSLFGIYASTYRIADYVEPVMAPPPAPRSNTTCTRCGGPAYTGLLHVECMAAKCESPAELEPDDVVREVDGHLAKWPLVRAEFAGKRYDECREWHAAHVEPTYVAIGRGVVAKHPTEEGARAAWRLAVGGGR